MSPLELSQREFVSYCLKGNQAAIQFCQDLFSISQIWDDLIDRDKPVVNETINRMMWMVMIELPRNPFYYENSMALTQSMEIFFADWVDSNTLEKGSDHEQNLSFVLRDSIGTIVIQCARIIGGYQWMRDISVDVRRFVYDESLLDYKKALPEIGE